MQIRLDLQMMTSDYCIFVGGNLVTWRSKKQSVVSAETEYRAITLGMCELLWLQRLSKELKLLGNDKL